jgi:hypothetical protein
MADRSSRLFWRRHYPADHLAQTMTWPLIARAAHVALLDAQWIHGGLDADPHELRYHVPGMTAAQWRTSWPFLEPHFPLFGDQRQNPELAAERERAEEFVEQRRRAGKKGNKVRWLRSVDDE